MAMLKKYILCFFMFSISACTTNQVYEKDGANTQMSAERAEQEISSAIYFFQHKLTPNWVFESEGALFFDLYHGQNEKYLEAAAEMVNSQFASEITISAVEARDAVVIKFPEPTQLGNCYFALIVSAGDGLSYYTYEKTMTFGEEGVVGMVGGWTSNGTHLNLGARGYTSEDDFLNDILSAK